MSCANHGHRAPSADDVSSADGAARADDVPSADYAARAERATIARRLVLIGALLLLAGMALAVVVKGHPAPLPGDVGAELAVQHALLARGPLTAIVEGVSTINFPLPSARLVATVAALLLLVRRWLDLFW